MVYDRIAEARSWLLRAHGIKKPIAREMDAHLLRIETALKANNDLPLEDARQWAHAQELHRTTLTSIFLAHLDAIGDAYRQMQIQRPQYKRRRKQR